MKSRIVIVFVGVLVLWSALILRAAYLQFLPNDRLQSLQNRQFQTVVTLQARRGAITDNAGRDLAMSATAYSLYADPKIIENKKVVAKKIAKELNTTFENVYSKIKDNNKRFVWIQRLLDQDKADRVKALSVRGLSFVQEWKRVYPNENLLAQTVGFLGSEGQGLEGVEKEFDTILRGNNKKVSVRKDARGRPLIADGLLFTENPDGSEVRLTVDSELQYSLETELHNAMTQFEAESAIGVILDAQTSAVVAMASVPTFDLNKAMNTPAAIRRNKVVTDAFEPGSTMKTFVIASALKKNLIAPNTKFFCENGSYRVGDKVIHEAEAHEKFGNMTVSDILAFSSNIGTTKIAFKMGDDMLRSGLLDFGFGAKMDLDIPGYARGMIQPLPWRPHLLSNISFGHGISATPIQIANAYAAIANGGMLNNPYIVDSIRDSETGEIQQTPVKNIRRVLSSEQAAQMKIMLTGVTTDGSGKNAQVDGYIVAGKTGTAQKVNPNGRGYLKGAYISSFAGFIPANDPKYVIYVAVDSPKKSYYGAAVAAPIFSRIASFAVRKAGIPPSKVQQKNFLAKKSPIVERTVAAEVNSVEENQEGLVPNYSNLTTREVLRRASSQGISVNIKGQGTVSEVIPAVGSPLPADKNITVILR